MHTNRFWELLARQLSDEITPEELQELNYLKGEDEFATFNDELLKSVSAISLQPKEEVTGEYLHQKWDAFQQKISMSATQAEAPKPAILKKLITYISVAASIALLAITGWKFLYPKAPEESTKPNIISTRNGSRSKIQMPDSTQVMLNAGSSLQYNNKTYGRQLREVELIGEAYFDVVKDAAHPFIIHTKAMDVKVIGTTFNIRAYPNEKQTETALIRGAIEVSFPGRPAEKLFLKPNEKITVANDRPVAISKKITAPQPSAGNPIIMLSPITFEPADSAVIETSWTRNKLIFRSKNFEELAQDMERWYNVSIRFSDSSLMQRRLTGTFKNETVFEALNYLKLSSPFQYSFTKETNTIILSR